MGKATSILTDQDRSKLDGIVKKMVENNEPEDNIRFVVEDFKSKYGKKKDSPSGITPSYDGTTPGSSAGPSSGLVPTGVETEADIAIRNKWKKVMEPAKATDADYDPTDPAGSVAKIVYAKTSGLGKFQKVKETASSTGQEMQLPLLAKTEKAAEQAEARKKEQGNKFLLSHDEASKMVKQIESGYANDTYASTEHMMKATGVQNPEQFFTMTDEELIGAARPGNRTDQIAVQRLMDARKVRKALTSADNIEQMAAAYAGFNDPQTAKQLERGAIALPQTDIGEILSGQPAKTVMGDPRSLFSEATMGKMMFDFLNNSATQQEISRFPEAYKQFKQSAPLLINKYPDFGVAYLGNIISQKMEDLGMNNSILNVVTKEETDKVVDELLKEGRISENEVQFYKDNMRESGIKNFGKKLIGRQTYDTPGLIESAGASFVKGAQDIYKGAAEVSGFRQAYLGKELLNARDMADRDNAVTVEAKSVMNEISQFGGQFLGQSLSIGAGGKILQSIKAVKKIDNAVAIVGGIQAYANYIPTARQMFPGDELKQRGYATIMASIEMATENIFRDAKVIEGITGKVRPEIKRIISDFTPESLASLEAKKSLKDVIANAVAKTPEFAGYMAKAGFQNTVEEEAAQLGQQVVDGLFQNKKVEDYINGEELWQTARQAILGSPFISTMSARSDMLRNRGITAKTVYEMAQDPEYWKGQIKEYAKLDPDFAATAADKIANLQYAASVVKEIADTPMNDQQKAKYLITSLNNKVRTEAMKNIVDPVIQKKEKEAIVANEKVQEELLAGKDSGLIEYDKSDGIEPTPEQEPVPAEQPAQVKEPEVKKERTIEVVEEEINNLQNDLADLESLIDDPDEDQAELNADIKVGQQQLDELYKERDSITTKTPENEKRQEEKVLTPAPEPAGEQAAPAVSDPDAVVKERQKEWKQPKGKYKVVYENGKRVVKTKRGKVVPEYITKEVRKAGGAIVPQKVKNPEWNRIALQHAKQFNFNTGETTEGKTPPPLKDETEGNRWVIENSQNPAEIAAAYLKLQKEPVKLDPKDLAIARNIGKVKASSFKQDGGDRNKITKTMAETYFNKEEGEGMDQVAQQASNYGEGFDISPSDVADFMIRFPAGVDPDGMVKTEAHHQAETKFQELTGIPLDPGNGRTVIANQAAAQFKGQAREKVMEAIDPFDKTSVTDEQILNAAAWEGWRPVEVEGMDGFDDVKTDNNDKKTQVSNAPSADGGNPGTESQTGRDSGGEQGGSGRTDSGRDRGSEDTGDPDGTGDYTIDDARRELEELGDLDKQDDDGYDVPFMATTDTQAQLKKAQSALAKAQRELTNAEDKLAGSQASQQGMFGGATQGSMFSADREEAKAILYPLRENVKAAKAEVDKWSAKMKDEQSQADGQMSLFSFGQDYSPAVTKQFNKVKKAIEKVFSGIKGFKGVQVLTGKDFDVSMQAVAGTAEYMPKTDGTVYGFVHKGTMYINGDVLNVNTPLHEASHIFTKWARINAPELYAAGQQKAATSRYLTKVKGEKFYQDQSETMRKAGRSDAEIEEMFRDEALAFAVGDRGASIVNQEQRQSFREWLTRFWNSVKKLFGGGPKNLESMSANDFSKMTFDDLSQQIASRLLSGKQLNSQAITESKPEFMTLPDGKRVMVKNIADATDIIDGFYSPTENAINLVPQEKMTGNQWRTQILSRGAKKEELTWTGLDKFLESKKSESVSKSDVLNFLKENRIEIKEVVKGKTEWKEVKKDVWERKIDEINPSGRKTSGKVVIRLINGMYYGEPSTSKYTKKFNTLEEAQANYDKVDGFRTDTKFSQYQTPGKKENYKELLITYPGVAAKKSVYKTGEDEWAYDDEFGYTEYYYSEQDAIKARDKKRLSPMFKSGHFDEWNILVHLRMNTRTDADGKKVLFLEEVQSDWGQTGKKSGFSDSKYDKDDVSAIMRSAFGEAGTAELEYSPELSEIIADVLNNEPDAGNLEIDGGWSKEDVDKLFAAAKSYEFNGEPKGIAKAPFVTETNEWVRLGLKMAVKEAVKQGADKIAWTTGEQQNERYDLSNQIDILNWSDNEDGTFSVIGKKDGTAVFINYGIQKDQLQDYIGKEAADKIILNSEKTNNGTLEGVDLKVGGKGMKGFYGSPSEGSIGIIGNVAKSLFKQEPGIANINLGEKTYQERKFDSLAESLQFEKELQERGEKGVTAFTNPDGSHTIEWKVSKPSGQHSIEITPELKASVEEGQPLFMAQTNSKGSRIAGIVQKLFGTGHTEAQVRGLLSTQGYSDLLADNIIANAKRMPVYKRVKAAAQQGPAQAPPRPAVLAHDDKTTWQKIKQGAKKYKGKLFSVHKGMPEFVLPLGEKTRGMQNWEVNEAFKTVKKLKEAAKKAGFSDWDKVDAALRGLKQQNTQPGVTPQVLLDLPESMRDLVLQMRAQIDGLSIDLVGRGLVGVEQAMAIEKNLGEYMTRSYAAFTDKKWAKKIPQKVKDDALQFLYYQRFNEIRDADDTISENDAAIQADIDANKRLKSIIDGLDEKFNPTKIKTMKGRDNGILKQRDEIPVEIRNLLGEYTDPGQGFMMTIAKMASLRSQAEFLASVRDIGMGKIFFEENDPNRPAEASIPLRSTGSSSWYPLGGLFTTPEVAEIFNESDPLRNEATNAWMKFVGAVRWGKTVGSIVTQFKNLESNIGFAVMNGHLKLGKIADPAKYYWDNLKGGIQSDYEVVDAAAKLGLIGQNVGVRELHEMLNDGSAERMVKAASTGDVSLLKKLSNKPGQVFDYMNKVYSASDDFFKLYGFVNEREILSGARFGVSWKELTPEQQSAIDTEAAERVKNTYPTYDRVWEGAKWLSKRVPLFGNFLSFQAESIRVLINTFEYAVKDLKDPQMRSAGLRRLSGIFLYNSVRASTLYYMAQVTGFGIAGFFGGGDDDEEQNLDDINRFVMPFMVNGEKMVRKTGPGKYVVVDVTSLEPYGIWFKTLNASRKGAGEMALEFFGPFGEREMTFGTIEQIVNNDNGSTGRIYNPDDPAGNKVIDAAGFAWKKLKPSTIGFVERLIEREDKYNELAALAGARSYTIDVEKSFSIKVLNMERQVVENDYAYKDKKRGITDPVKLREIAADFQASHNALMESVKQDKLAAIRLGADPDKIRKILYTSLRMNIDPVQKVDFGYMMEMKGATPNRYERKVESQINRK